ncbi:MAG: hypothetical protein D6675_13070 [Gemmatimonadetes bacterium]|nr:MAG: hypothetical protein D6675_13070 [Gemmatimonadota bacterium]
MDWTTINWKTLERLRKAFLTGTAGTHDYWQSEDDLHHYDETFAQRIRWKWQYVLRELVRRNWQPPTGMLLDWGCGSGVAHRTFLDQFGADRVQSLCLWDRSPRARHFAANRAKHAFPKLNVEIRSGITGGICLISHVLTELSPDRVSDLLTLARQATAIIWVEPGTYAVSHQLIDIRERLTPDFNIIAPCPHQMTCGLLLPEHQPHWCHFFADSPPEIFHDPNWSKFARLAGVDLRSLPLSYLVLDKRPFPALPRNAVRVLGRPRWHKGYGLLLGCAQNGVAEKRLTKRRLPAPFKSMKKRRLDSLQCWTCEGNEITKLTEITP